MDTARMETVCCNELVCNFLIPALCGSGTEGFLTCGFLTLLHSGLNMVFPGWATCPASAPCRSDCSNFLSLRCRHRCCDALCATAVCWWEEEQGLLLLVVAGRPRWLCSREMWWATALIEVQEDLQLWVAAAMVAREMCDKKVIKKKFSPCYWLQKKKICMKMNWCVGLGTSLWYLESEGRGMSLKGTYGSLPTWDVLWFCDTHATCL